MLDSDIVGGDSVSHRGTAIAKVNKTGLSRGQKTSISQPQRLLLCVTEKRRGSLFAIGRLLGPAVLKVEKRVLSKKKKQAHEWNPRKPTQQDGKDIKIKV